MDLSNKFELFKFQTNSEHQILELIKKGETALNLEILCKQEIRFASLGSFLIAQRLCQEACILSNVEEAQASTTQVGPSFQLVKSRVVNNLSNTFKPLALNFATGGIEDTDMRGLCVYLLYWLSKSNDWSISLWSERTAHPEQIKAIETAISGRMLQRILLADDNFSKVLHFDEATQLVIAEDPQFVFWLRALNWNVFAKNAGYPNIRFPKDHDFAIVFSADKSDVALMLKTSLLEQGFRVFFDVQEEERLIAAATPQDYLLPVYDSNSDFVVPLLSEQFPTRIWYQLEADTFKRELSMDSVIPIRFSDCPKDRFTNSSEVSTADFDVTDNHNNQLAKITNALALRSKKRHMKA
jgi:hypothetical protein